MFASKCLVEFAAFASLATLAVPCVAGDPPAATGQVNVLDLGAKCDGLADDRAALQRGLDLVGGTGQALVLPAGRTCAYSASLEAHSSKWALIGGQGTTLKFTGRGDALVVDGTLSKNGAGEIVLRDLLLNAGAEGASCLHTRKMTRSIVSNVECRGAKDTAFLFEFSVSVLFQSLKVSSNSGPFSSRPAAGILFTHWKGTNSANNTLVNVIVEGVQGAGIVLNGAIGTTFIGGTSEGNGGRGIRLQGSTERTVFLNTHLEGNQAGDVEVTGAEVRQTRFINSSAQQGIIIDGARETILDGGSFGAVDVRAGSVATQLVNSVRYGSFSDQGTLTHVIGENAAVPNKLAATALPGGPPASSMWAIAVGDFSAGRVWGMTVFEQPVKIVRITAALSSLGEGCSQYPQVAVTNSSGRPLAKTVFQLGETATFNSGALSVELAPATEYKIEVIRPAQCRTLPGPANIVVQYRK